MHSGVWTCTGSDTHNQGPCWLCNLLEQKAKQNAKFVHVSLYNFSHANCKSETKTQRVLQSNLSIATVCYSEHTLSRVHTRTY